ncbi:MAG TPA: hypothetical protein VE093_24985 [Polyangiaceae bacterium]|nr:hypothetical protein [Polyangiaceae bacterium]
MSHRTSYKSGEAPCTDSTADLGRKFAWKTDRELRRWFTHADVLPE